jgi:hypothetical protein
LPVPPAAPSDAETPPGIEAPPNVRVLRDELEDDSVGEVTLEGSLDLPLPRLFGFAS